MNNNCGKFESPPLYKNFHMVEIAVYSVVRNRNAGHTTLLGSTLPSCDKDKFIFLWALSHPYKRNINIFMAVGSFYLIVSSLSQFDCLLQLLITTFHRGSVE